MKKVIWLGSSKADWIGFPESVQDEAGYQLDRIQRGEEPSDWKPMSGIGGGVREIRIRDEQSGFRVILGNAAGRCLCAARFSEENPQGQSARLAVGCGEIQ